MIFQGRSLSASASRPARDAASGIGPWLAASRYATPSEGAKRSANAAAPVAMP